MNFFYSRLLMITLACLGWISANAQSNGHNEASSPSTTCVTLRFTQSSTINNYHPSYNYGTSHELDAIGWTMSGTPTIWRSVLDFNFDTIPAGATISSAVLSLYGDSAADEPQADSNLSGSDSWVIGRVTSAWIGNTVTWATQPTFTSVDSVQMPASTSVYEDFPNIDVSSLVQDIVNNLPSEYGMILKLNNENYYRSMVFCSNLYPNPARRPKLVICYRNATGLSNINDNSGLSIYPNPSSSYLTVTYSTTGNIPATYKIYNTLGMLIKENILPGQGNLLTQNINTANLSAGIYLFQLNNGKNILNKQFIKE